MCPHSSGFSAGFNISKAACLDCFARFLSPNIPFVCIASLSRVHLEVAKQASKRWRISISLLPVGEVPDMERTINMGGPRLFGSLYSTIKSNRKEDRLPVLNLLPIVFLSPCALLPVLQTQVSKKAGTFQ